jgi:hypothetical protein
MRAFTPLLQEYLPLLLAIIALVLATVAHFMKKAPKLPWFIAGLSLYLLNQAFMRSLIGLQIVRNEGSNPIFSAICFLHRTLGPSVLWIGVVLALAFGLFAKARKTEA